MTDFGKITLGIVKEFRKILGNSAVIYEDKQTLENYSSDEAGGKYYSHMPDVVLKPSNAKQISEIIKIANKERIPITPRGAGSGLAGGAVPIYGGIVICLERMNRILEIDKTDLTAVVEPGVVTNDLCRKVADMGLYYAGYPMSVETSLIGGNVATNAGGSKVIKYGNTGHHVLGIEAVLPNSEIVQFGGKRRKDSSGYDIKHLLVGSEGTLGIFTKIFLNLIPQPGKNVDLLVPFRNVDEAISNVSTLIIESKVLPTAIEYIDHLSIILGSEYNNIELPFQEEAGAYLIIQYEGQDKKELENIYERVGNALLNSGALDVFIADNRTNSEKIWRVRRNWLEALKFFDPYVPTGDVVIPTSKIPQIVRFVKEISKEYNVEIPIAGHAADGNLHPAPMKPQNISVHEWKVISEEILSRIAIKAAEFGGAVSGEHGIGFIKKELLRKTKNLQYKIMKSIKVNIDPNNIMNPGKIF